MNRREFIQALIGIPLMPLLAAEAGAAGLWGGVAGELMVFEWDEATWDWLPVTPYQLPNPYSTMRIVSVDVDEKVIICEWVS